MKLSFILCRSWWPKFDFGLDYGLLIVFITLLDNVIKELIEQHMDVNATKGLG
jgi:hypothetical protein